MGVKLNLGCGFDRRAGWIGVDAEAACSPDVVHDIEQVPWPFDDDAADEVLLSHVLEHIGATPRAFMTVIEELYRVCADGATVTVVIPHPRHDDFLLDPTHVRPLLPESFLLFSAETCEKLRAEGAGDTPLALILGVDFRIDHIEHRLDPAWREKLVAGTVTEAEVASAARRENNVIKESVVVLKVVKTPGDRR